MSAYLDSFRQCFFIPKPTLTEKNLPNQSGRVFIVTGGYAGKSGASAESLPDHYRDRHADPNLPSGVGKELCKILYQHNGTVYVAGRSQNKADAAIEEIKKAYPSSDGRLEFLHVDLADLSTIKKSVEDFTAREQRLDVLTNSKHPSSRHETALRHLPQPTTNHPSQTPA